MAIFESDHVCMACGHIGEPKKLANGSFAVEIIIWAVFIVIAASTSFLILIAPLAYSLSRTFNKKLVCGLCKGQQIIPADSPNGKETINKNSAQAKATE